MKDWTIMVYMAGDNNLSENMAYSLEELKNYSGLISDSGREKINLLAFFDSSSLTAPTYYIDYSGDETGKNEIETENKFHNKVKTPLPEKFIKDGNSSSAYSIMNFVRWCIEEQKRTAENYAIIFSGHSFGFHGTSFMRDESSSGSLTLFKFRWALEECIKRYFNKKVAILGFDSCMMSMLEIGYELKDVAQTVVASEGSLPNSGWSYAPMLGGMIDKFNNKISIDKIGRTPNHLDTARYVKDSAKNFVTEFIKKHNNLVIGGRSIDVAAWDLEQMDSLAKEVNELGKELNKFFDLVDKVQKENGKELKDEDVWAFHNLKKIVLQAHYDTQTYMNEQSIDLKDFCKRLIIELKFIEDDPKSAVFNDLKKICKNICGLVDECVLKSGFSGDEYQFSNGISLYFPWSYLAFSLTNYRYRYLIFNRGEDNFKDFENPQGVGQDWYLFLKNYLTRVTMRPARKQRNEDGEAATLAEVSGKSNPFWSKSNPFWSKSNPFWSRSNPPWSKSNPFWSKGEVGEYLFYFSRFKNFENRWDISGFADEFQFDNDFED